MEVLWGWFGVEVKLDGDGITSMGTGVDGCNFCPLQVSTIKQVVSMKEPLGIADCCYRSR